MGNLSQGEMCHSLVDWTVETGEWLGRGLIDFNLDHVPYSFTLKYKTRLAQNTHLQTSKNLYFMAKKIYLCTALNPSSSIHHRNYLLSQNYKLSYD